MADPGYYQNHLKKLLDDPSSFSGTPGYKFSVDQGMQAVNRSNSRQRGSGNALAALLDRGKGLASQDYSQHVDQLGRLSGQEQQYELGQGSLKLGQDRLALDDRLGTGQLGLGRDRLGLDRELGMGQLGLGRDRLGLDRDRMGLDRELGFGRLGNERYGMDQNYDLGMDRNNLTAAEQQNRFNIDNRRTDIDWFNANTNRGRARSDDFYAGEENERDWMPYRSPWQ